MTRPPESVSCTLTVFGEREREREREKKKVCVCVGGGGGGRTMQSHLQHATQGHQWIKVLEGLLLDTLRCNQSATEKGVHCLVEITAKIKYSKGNLATPGTCSQNLMNWSFSQRADDAIICVLQPDQGVVHTYSWLLRSWRFMIANYWINVWRIYLFIHLFSCWAWWNEEALTMMSEYSSNSITCIRHTNISFITHKNLAARKKMSICLLTANSGTVPSQLYAVLCSWKCRVKRESHEENHFSRNTISLEHAPKITCNWFPRCKSNNFLNAYCFSKTCITGTVQTKHMYEEKRLYTGKGRNFQPPETDIVKGTLQSSHPLRIYANEMREDSLEGWWLSETSFKDANQDLIRRQSASKTSQPGGGFLKWQRHY